MAFNHKPFSYVRQFTEDCVRFGCEPKEFDILENKTAADVALFLEQKFLIMAEEQDELCDSIALVAKQLRETGQAELSDVVEVYDAILDVAYVAVFLATVFKLPFAEGFERVCLNNASKLQGDAKIVNGKLKKPSNHVPVVLEDLVRGKWGNFIKE